MKETYLRWLKAAYGYYLGDSYDMTDSEWDAIARELYAKRAELPAAEFPVLHDERWTGGSVFWLGHADYPQEARP